MSATLEFLLSFLPSASQTDRVKVLEVLLPVLKEQEKPFLRRTKVQRKEFLSSGYHFSCKNYEGKDVLRNAFRIRFADYGAGVSLKETLLVPEGWFLVEKTLDFLRKEDLYLKVGGLVLVKTGDLYRINYGAHFIDLPEDERVKIANAVDRGLYYKNDELGVLVKEDGSVYLFTNFDRVFVKEPLKLLIFLRS